LLEIEDGNDWWIGLAMNSGCGMVGQLCVMVVVEGVLESG
jgi:hypothetical protein